MVQGKKKENDTRKDNALVATGAKVLGSITIGESSKVGAGSVVLKDVPDHSTVVGIPGRIVIQNGEKVRKDLDHHKLPDPISEVLKEMNDEIQRLNKEFEDLKGANRHDH